MQKVVQYVCKTVTEEKALETRPYFSSVFQDECQTFDSRIRPATEAFLALL